HGSTWNREGDRGDVDRHIEEKRLGTVGGHEALKPLPMVQKRIEPQIAVGSGGEDGSDAEENKGQRHKAPEPPGRPPTLVLSTMVRHDASRPVQRTERDRRLPM